MPLIDWFKIAMGLMAIALWVFIGAPIQATYNGKLHPWQLLLHRLWISALIAIATYAWIGA